MMLWLFFCQCPLACSMLVVQERQSGQQGALLETRGPTGPGAPTLSTAPEPEEQDSPQRQTGYTRPAVKTSTWSHAPTTHQYWIPRLPSVIWVPPCYGYRHWGPGSCRSHQEPPPKSPRAQEVATKGLLGAGHHPRRQSRGPRRQSPA